MEEQLDILDEHGNKTGVIRSYKDAHKEGLLHRSVNVWILNSKKELLLQKRSANKTAYPNQWDISAAGHISAGQTSLEAAQMETEEELGIVLPHSAFEYLFEIEEHIVLNGGTYVANEFQDVYLVRIDVDAASLRLADDEVAEVRWVGLDKFKSWTSGHGELMVPHEEEYARLITILSY